MIARAAACVVALALLALFPAVAGNYPVKLLQEILIWGIFAMSLDLLMGRAGMVSFGHSAFFGLGGYVAALALKAAPGMLAALVLGGVARLLLRDKLRSGTGILKLLRYQYSVVLCYKG